MGVETYNGRPGFVLQLDRMLRHVREEAVGCQLWRSEFDYRGSCSEVGYRFTIIANIDLLRGLLAALELADDSLELVDPDLCRLPRGAVSLDLESSGSELAFPFDDDFPLRLLLLCVDVRERRAAGGAPELIIFCWMIRSSFSRVP